MRILLINPPRWKGIPVIREERCEIIERYSILPPYSLMQIAALLKDGGRYEVSLLDANGLDLDFGKVKRTIQNFSPDVVLFRFTPTTFDWDMETVKLVKRVSTKTKTIGLCCTLAPLAKEVLNEVKELDVYLYHEYEAVSRPLIDALAKGDISKVKGIAHRSGGKVSLNPPATPIGDYDSLPLPAYELLPSLDPYFINTPAGGPFTILYTSKGCPFKCNFCTVANTPLKLRSAKSVLDEVSYLRKRHGVRTVSFFDETFTIKRKRVEDICKEMSTLGIQWYCNTRANLVDKKLLKMMWEGGCRGISFGIESGSQNILDSCAKHVSLEKAKDAIEEANSIGIKTYCSFIIGLPGETWETVAETISFVKETLPTSAQFNVAVPYPGTELYKRARDELGRPPSWRELFQDRSVMGSENMTPDDIDKARDMAYRSLYSNPKWWAKNIGHTLKQPQDMYLATRYAMKIANNLLVHGMSHSH